MPKAFSKNERKLIKGEMINVGSTLLRRKGVKQVTIEDITSGVNIAKGSFYSFYNSREELFWDIIKNEEQGLLRKIETVARGEFSIDKKLRTIFFDLVLENDCIIFYLSEEDIKYITRKLPPNIIDKDKTDGQSIIQSLLSLCGLNETIESAELIMTMIHTLQFVASNNDFSSEDIKRKMLEILVNSYTEYFMRGFS